MSSIRSATITSTSNNNVIEVPLNGLVARKRHREKRAIIRKRIFSSGWRSNVLYAMCLVTACLLCFAHFEQLQADADYKLIEFNYMPIELPKAFLTSLVRCGHLISGVMFVLHLVAVKLSKARFTFSALLLILAWPALFLLHYEQVHHHDYLITRLAVSAFTLIITTSIMFLPKKQKRNRRKNTFYSAFSIASTPRSQRSSRFDQSHLSSSTNSMDNEMMNSLPSSSTSRLLASNDGSNLLTHSNGQIRCRTYMNKKNIEEQSYAGKRTELDTMSLRSGKMLSKQRAAYETSTSVSPTKIFGWREKMREATPMREVRHLIDDLLIYSTDDDTDLDDEVTSEQSELSRGRERMCKMPAKMLSPGAVSPNVRRRNDHQGPFASLTYNPAVRKNNRTSCGLFGNQDNRSTLTSYAHSSCSSLSESNVNSSPFRHL